MPKIAKTLTDHRIKLLRPESGQAGWSDIGDGGCRGLMLRLSPRGEKVWALRVLINGKRSRHLLGGYPAVTLAEARQRAIAYQAGARDGARPAELDARREAEAMTVSIAHARYIDALRNGLSARTVKLKEGMFVDHIKPIAGMRLLRKVRRADVVEVVDKVRAKGLAVQANRVFSELMALLRWAEQRGLIDGVPSFQKFKTKERHRARTLTDPEIKAVWTIADDLGDLTRDFLRLLLLTGQRRDEVRLMTWEEVDLDAELWTIPAARYKTRVVQAVALSPAALKILRARWTPDASGYVLPGRKASQPFNGAASAMRRLRKVLLRGGDFTIHDLRRTCRTGLARLGVDELTAELVIGHRPQGLLKVYDQHARMDERRDALGRWAGCVLTMADEIGDNVVPIRGNA
jgi:integrase